jgi:lambda repressor-like predicted transcriptional regulator
MSNYQEIDSLEDKLTEMIRGRAIYKERLADIERDENLSSTGRHTEAVELCEKARAKHEALRAAYDAEVEETRASLRKKAFSPQFGYLTDQAEKVATRAAYAAAMDRAAGMSTEELRAALERALRADDELSAQAIAHVAWEKGASRVLEVFMEHDKNGNLRRLYQFEAAYGDRRTAQRKFEQHLAFSPPDWPTF